MDHSTVRQSLYLELSASDWRNDYALLLSLPERSVRIKLPVPIFDKLHIRVGDSESRVFNFRLVAPEPPLPAGIDAEDCFLGFEPNNRNSARFFWVPSGEQRAAVAAISISEPDHPEREIRLLVVPGEMRHYETDLPDSCPIIYGEALRQSNAQAFDCRADAAFELAGRASS